MTATLVPSTPSFLGAYLKESKPDDLNSVWIMVPGADKTPEWLRTEFRKKHNIELLEGYGATETSPIISTNTPEANKPGSIGKPLTGVRVQIAYVNTGAIL